MMTSSPSSRGRERMITAYPSADGNPPSGVDDGVDDGPAIHAALADGPGVVRIPPGYYRFSVARVPAEVTVVGAGDATVIRPSNEHHPVFEQVGVGHWSIRDLVLDGEASEPWRQRRDLGLTGLNVSDAWGFNITGLTVRNFNGRGVSITHTRLNAAAYCHGGTIDGLTAVGNATGVCLDERGEYVTLTNSHLMQNTTGLIVHAGNAKISQCNIGGNIDGVVIDDKVNGSHGLIANCHINHNERYALDCRKVRYGMIVNACGIFYGKVRLCDSAGVHITNCQVSCDVSFDSEAVNAFIHNYVIEEDFTFGFCDSTLVQGNYTSEGTWCKNRERADMINVINKV